MKKNIYILTFILILLLAFLLRRHTFSLPHFRGDQHHYIALAYKLDIRGMTSYNLRGIDMYANRNYPDLVQFAYSPGKGNVLEALEAGNITYYDQPLHHLPFGFPAAIMFSHRIFSGKSPYFLVRSTEFDEVIATSPGSKNLKSIQIHQAVTAKQFYSVVIPLFSSLLLITLVFFLSKELYDDKIAALVAMFVMAINPIDILTSQKIWSDDMTAALAVLAVLLYIRSVNRNNRILSLAGGLACGLSAITKQSGAFILIIIVLWHYLSNFKDIFRKETALKTIFSPHLVLFIIGFTLASGWWFYKVYSVYGSPIYRPHQAGISSTAMIEWFRVVGRRSPYIYLVGIPYQNPLFALAFLLPVWMFIERSRIKSSFLLFLWMVVFLYIFQVYLGGGGKEHRYMLPSYPAFAIAGAYVANKIRIYLDSRSRFWGGSLILVLVLIYCAFWSVPMAYESLFNNDALILKPF